MAISGSIDFSVNRNELIKASLRLVNGYTPGEPVEAQALTDASEALNIMLKSWQADGLQLWAIKEYTLIPELNKQKYSFGTSGDEVSLSTGFWKTEVKVAASATDTAIDVDSTADMTAGDVICIVLDDGTLHQTTVNGAPPDSDTVNITTAIPTGASVAINQHVYGYTTRAGRPLEVLEVYRREYDTSIDVPLKKLSREDYYTLSDKDSSGVPVNFYYDPQLTNSNMYVWPVADSTFANNSVFIIRAREAFDDMDTSTNDFDFPVEWTEAIKYGLAARLASEYRIPLNERRLLWQEAELIKSKVLTWDQEHTSIYLRPDFEGGN